MFIMDKLEKNCSACDLIAFRYKTILFITTEKSQQILCLILKHPQVKLYCFHIIYFTKALDAASRMGMK